MRSRLVFAIIAFLSAIGLLSLTIALSTMISFSLLAARHSAVSRRLHKYQPLASKDMPAQLKFNLIYMSLLAKQQKHNTTPQVHDTTNRVAFECGISPRLASSSATTTTTRKRQQPSLLRKIGRIVNGIEAVAHSHPWIVSLRRVTMSSPPGTKSSRTPHYNDHFCSGVLVSPRHVLTAAHCVFDMAGDATRLVAVVGLHARTDIAQTALRKRTHQVSKLIVHENFTKADMSLNDIALLVLAQPAFGGDKDYAAQDTTARANELVRPVCLPSAAIRVVDNETSATYDFRGRRALTVGWGLREDGRAASTLQQANLFVQQDIDECLLDNAGQANASASNASTGESTVNRMLLCALDSRNDDEAFDNHSSVCYGDSGGPLITQLDEYGDPEAGDDDDNDSKWILIGIVSFVYGYDASSNGSNIVKCGNRFSRSFFTSVSFYSNWIEAHMKAT